MAHGGRSVLTGVRLALALAVRRDVELWVGDSHAQSHNGPRPNTRLSRATRGVYVWYLGPRLLWSVAQHGFPAGLLRFCRLLRALPRRGELTLLVLLGEIDVRAHLATHVRPDGVADLGFVRSYVGEIAGLAAAVRADETLVVVPPPPSYTGAVNPEWPVRGTFGERLALFTKLRGELASVTRTCGVPRLKLLDLTPWIMERDGALEQTKTDDQVHLNPTGAAVVRRMLDRRTRDRHL